MSEKQELDQQRDELEKDAKSCGVEPPEHEDHKKRSSSEIDEEITKLKNEMVEGNKDLEDSDEEKKKKCCIY